MIVYIIVAHENKFDFFLLSFRFTEVKNIWAWDFSRS